MGLVINTQEGHKYLPPLYAEEFSQIQRHFQPLSNNASRPDPVLEIEYEAVTPFWFRIGQVMAQSQEMMEKMGLSKHDLDDVKEFFGKQRLWVLALTYVISMLHMLFDFLAFKEDIGFYRGRTNYVGISSRTITSKFICSLGDYVGTFSNASSN